MGPWTYYPASCPLPPLEDFYTWKPDLLLPLEDSYTSNTDLLNEVSDVAALGVKRGVDLCVERRHIRPVDVRTVQVPQSRHDGLSCRVN